MMDNKIKILTIDTIIKRLAEKNLDFTMCYVYIIGMIKPINIIIADTYTVGLSSEYQDLLVYESKQSILNALGSSNGVIRFNDILIPKSNITHIRYV